MKFTIFTPCFNSSNFIERTYQSLLKQTFTDFEWLVIDDCSSDDTYKLLRSFKKENEVNISLHKNEENLMLARTCNKAVEIARGEFLYSWVMTTNLQKKMPCKDSMRFGNL